jgi:hypothetical protein
MNCPGGSRLDWRYAIAWATVPLLLATSCAIFQPALQSPAKSGVVWREVMSEHFVLYTDLAPDEARRRAQEFETLRDALVKVAFDEGNAKEPRVSIVLFDRDADFEAVAPFGVGGFANSSLALDLERHAVLVLPSRAGDPARRTFVHEEVHELMHRAFGNSPVWLNEGMADYFSTLRFEGDAVFVGYGIPDRAKVPTYLIPTAAEILRADRACFRPEESDARTAARFYTGAWMLIHFFHNGPDEFRRHGRDVVDPRRKDPACAARHPDGAPHGPGRSLLFGLALATGDCGATANEAPVDTHLCESLVASARSPEENTLAAAYLRLTGHDADALARAKAAVRTDLRCEMCAATLAEMLVADGHVAAAITVLEHATSVRAETPQDRTLAATLEKYRMMLTTR